MNSRELRIGNYVEMESVIREVVAIYDNGKDEIGLREPGKEVTVVHSGEVKPIMLTKELVTKHCSFDANQRRVLGIDHQRYLLRFYKCYIILSDRKDEPIIHFWDVKALHQLQNLHFALKGMELDVVFDN